MGALVPVLALAGCAGTRSTSSSTGPQAAASAAPQHLIDVRKMNCPSLLPGEYGGSPCKVADDPVRLRECHDFGPGGYDVGVAGISCREGRGLRIPLGSGFHTYGRARQHVYESWTAHGPWEHVVPDRDIGWTCWKGYDPHGSQGVLHVCWRGTDLLLFQVG